MRDDAALLGEIAGGCGGVPKCYQKRYWIFLSSPLRYLMADAERRLVHHFSSKQDKSSLAPRDPADSRKE